MNKYVSRALRKGLNTMPLIREVSFIAAKPMWPSTVEKPAEISKLGADYDTSWARKPFARVIRRLMIESITRPMVKTIASPTIIGIDRLKELTGPAIFVANHSSHLDTSVLLATLPSKKRHRTVVAARSEYFFDKHWKAVLWSLWINVIPIERSKASRRSILLAEKILKEGWNLVIYPEESRGEDDFLLPFKPGAAYLSVRNNIPVVPVHMEGVRKIFTPYTHRLQPGPTKVTFGQPIWPNEGEKAQDFTKRIEHAVEFAADEGNTDWWSARSRAAKGETPSLQSPAELSGWRKTWTSTKETQKKKKHRWPL